MEYAFKVLDTRPLPQGKTGKWRRGVLQGHRGGRPGSWAGMCSCLRILVWGWLALQTLLRKWRGYVAHFTHAACCTPMRQTPLHHPALPLPPLPVKIIDLEGLTMRDVGSSAFKWWAQAPPCATRSPRCRRCLVLLRSRACTG